MSAGVSDPSIDRRVVWSDHARDQWRSSRSDSDQPCREAFRDTKLVEYPDAHGGAYGRYHEGGDCVLILQDELDQGRETTVIVTVIDLTDRPPWEQHYVRCQAHYGGDSHE